MELDKKDRKDEVMKDLRAYFKPEFLNRLDDIVIFNPLGKEQIAQIVSIMFDSVKKKLEALDIRVELEESAKELVAEAGFDFVYGARPLKRAMYDLIEDKLAQMILEDKLLVGDSVKIYAKDGEIEIK